LRACPCSCKHQHSSARASVEDGTDGHCSDRGCRWPGDRCHKAAYMRHAPCMCHAGMQHGCSTQHTQAAAPSAFDAADFKGGFRQHSDGVVPMHPGDATQHSSGDAKWTAVHCAERRWHVVSGKLWHAGLQGLGPILG
jgi:hypothetical protein